VVLAGHSYLLIEVLDLQFFTGETSESKSTRNQVFLSMPKMLGKEIAAKDTIDIRDRLLELTGHSIKRRTIQLKKNLIFGELSFWRILAEFMYGADKVTAHLTEDSGHKLWDNDGEVFFRGCEIIHQRVSAACSTAKVRLARSA
jgi:hypothetical protein